MRRSLPLLVAASLGLAMGVGAHATLSAWKRARAVRLRFRADPKLVLDLARSRLQTQLAFADALDAKLGGLFAAASALLGLLAAIFAFGEGTDVTGGLPQDAGLGVREAAIFSVALGLYGVAVVSAIAGWPRTWQIGPSVDTAFKESQTLHPTDFVARQISGYIDNWQKNRARSNLKAWALRLSFAAVLGEAGCVAAAIWTVVF